jgi:hypothetical protein
VAARRTTGRSLTGRTRGERAGTHRRLVRVCSAADLGEDEPVHVDVGRCPVCLVIVMEPRAGGGTPLAMPVRGLWPDLVAQRLPGRAQEQLGDHRGPLALGCHRELGIIFCDHPASSR